MSVSPFAWAALVGVVLVLLVLDMFVVNRRQHALGMGEAARWSVLWLVLGLLAGLVVWAALGADAAQSYWAGYLVERALSLDNVFVFAVIMGAFAIPARRRLRLLSYGIAGALVLRAGFIVAGAAALEAFHVVLYAFGALLVATGVRVAVKHEPAGGEPGVLRWVRRAAPRATPFAAALATIVVADVIFAVDSVPAILAITTDTFVVLAANAFALLGLRSLYFLLDGMAGRFAYLQAGLGAVLVFVGAKMLLTDVAGHLSPALSLVVIAAILAAAVGASVWRERREATPDRRARSTSASRPTPAASSPSARPASDARRS